VPSSIPPASSILPIVRRLAAEVDALAFSAPAAYVYNPLIYARAPLERYLERWGRGEREIVLVGMNPGPFGMMQTGVPFGEVALVRDWIGVEGAVERPPHEHPKRPVEGFGCARSEVSGARLWGWARARFGTPERFFARFFVWNWCPLGFLAESGANLTPDKLKPAERRALEAVCDAALGEVVAALAPRLVFGVGGVALAALGRATAGAVPLALLPHPSPASPAANRGWTEIAERAFADAGVALPDDEPPGQPASGSSGRRSDSTAAT
jgi:single-strand selective monofunctional uracil DNA glycosylase